jgi:hypothetical protein
MLHSNKGSGSNIDIRHIRWHTRHKCYCTLELDQGTSTIDESLVQLNLLSCRALESFVLCVCVLVSTALLVMFVG